MSAGHRVRLGVPTAQTLVYARSGGQDGDHQRLHGARRVLGGRRAQLDELGIRGKLVIPVHHGALRENEPRRKVIRIREKKVVGFPLHAAELTAEESLLLQQNGLGGRRKMGCGFFAPIPPREARQ